MELRKQGRNRCGSLNTVVVTIVCIGASLFLWMGFVPRVTCPLIIIPGGGVSANGEVPSHTQLRLEKAVEFYNSRKQDSPLMITLSGGTPHKPNPLDSAGFPVWESTAAAKKLVKMGIPSLSIMEESFSLDTVGNVCPTIFITYNLFFITMAYFLVRLIFSVPFTLILDDIQISLSLLTTGTWIGQKLSSRLFLDCLRKNVSFV